MLMTGYRQKPGFANMDSYRTALGVKILFLCREVQKR